MPRKLAIASWGLLGVLGCSKETSSSTFRIDVLGSRSSVVDRTINADGATQIGDPKFTGSRFDVTFEANASLDELVDTGASIVLSVDSPVTSQLAISPFVCEALGDRYQELRSQDYSALETYKVILTDESEWKINTDYTRRLSYTCDLWHSGGGESVSSIFAQENRCDAPEAAGTTVSVDSGGVLPGLTPDICEATETDRGDGTFGVQVSLKSPEYFLLVHAGFCFPPEGPVFPVTWNAETAVADPECFEGTSAELTDKRGANGPMPLNLRGGSWTVENAAFGDPGSHVTRLSLTFDIPTQPSQSLGVDAVMKGPVYRIPVEGMP